MFIPKIDYRFKCVTDITADALRKMGAKAVGLDIDNTICFDGTMDFAEGVEKWIADIKGAGFPIIIITNATNPRASNVAKKLGLPYVHLAKKPFSFKLKIAAKKMGVNVNEMAMLGDQLFADIKAANKCGAIAVRIDPMEGETRFPRYYARRRKKEEPILLEFEKNHGYGVE